MPSQLDSLKRWSPEAPGRLGSDLACPTLAVASGKGGVGKSHVSLSIALSLADLGRKVLLIDGDMGLANLHILCGLHPTRDLDDVLAGRCGPEEALLSVEAGVDLLPAASGVAHLSALPAARLRDLSIALSRLQSGYDLAVVDTGAGIGDTTLNLVLASDRLLVVTTPEPTAQADAYALMKVLQSHRRDLPAKLCVNLAADEEEAVRTSSRLSQVCARFLGWEPSMAGWIPRQEGMDRHIMARRPAFRAEPDSPFARAMRSVAREATSGMDSGGKFFARLSNAAGAPAPAP
jgi:flagellar biosynthesis protein FlhG